MEGKPTKDPAFNLAALWIPAERAALARSKGYTVVDDVSVMGTHLSEVVRRHAHELFSRQDTKNFCDRVAQSNPKVVEDLVPKMLSLSVIQRVLQNLLRERVPIRDSVTILEALSEGAQMTKNPVLLTEYVRQSIRRAIVSSHTTPQGELAAYHGGALGRTRGGGGGGTQRAQQRARPGAAIGPRPGGPHHAQTGAAGFFGGGAGEPLHSLLRQATARDRLPGRHGALA